MEKPIIVVKVGTSTLMGPQGGGGPNLANIGALVETLANMHAQGFRVILVTSGAVGFGCLKLKMKERPKSLALKQAVAAAGQSQLMRIYEDLFGMLGVSVAQILLSRFDFAAKDRFANVLATIGELLRLRVIPIINENDTVTSGDIRFGNNDTLGALVAVGVSAQKFFLLTDVDCLFTDNPRTNPSAVPIPVVSAAELATLAADSSGGEWGTGGMATKIVAARTAVCAGIETILCHGAYPSRMTDYLGEGGMSKSATISNGSHALVPWTVFKAGALEEKIASTMTPHRRWILALPVKGTLLLDEGAVKAVGNKTSLLAAGVLEIEGEFAKEQAVSLVSKKTGAEIARALANMSSAEMHKVKGLHSNEYAKALGYEAEPELAHRPSIVIISVVAK